MRISWLSPAEIAAARRALTAGGATWDDHFTGPGAFASPASPDDAQLLDWERITEHVARAERVSEVVREHGLAAARRRFAGSGVAIEAATLAAAAHEDGALDFPQVIGVLECAIDNYVFYAPFLELLVKLAGDEMDRALGVYEAFVTAYARALEVVPHGSRRIGAARDGLADVYVRAGRVDAAEELYERRHEEDLNDVAVALSASRAFLAAGRVGHAVRWLGIAAARASALGRDELATRLRAKQEIVRRRLS
jgi:pentatricopeptide repeat protein